MHRTTGPREQGSGRSGLSQAESFSYLLLTQQMQGHAPVPSMCGEHKVSPAASRKEPFELRSDGHKPSAVVFRTYSH